jgi:hypothetical protein
MNYKNIYNKIIEFRIDNVPAGYVERHHIIPRSLGGSDKECNIVALTAREHFICHLLLTKIHPENTPSWGKMVKAFMMMLRTKSAGQERWYTSKTYASIRAQFAAVQSISQTGTGNSQFGTKWIHNIESNISKKMHINEALPIGWAEGRTAKIINYARIKAVEIKKQQTTMQYNAWYKIYSKLGFTEFVLQTGYDKSQSNLVSMFSKYATNYIPQNGKRRRVVPI